MRATSILLAAMVLASCSKEPQGERQTIDSETVDKALAGKPVPIELAPLRLPDIEKHQIYGTSCAFAAEGGGLAAVAIAMTDAGYLKVGKEVLRFAADKGSAEMPFGTWTEYDGLARSFELETTLGDPPQPGGRTVTFPGRLTVRDEHERVVYDRPGEIQCNKG
ncbi:hypothetical protein SZ64_05820 [Erythrobacter sp. SG61-1L]|uniref:hypothetical protein n=1 Tax=Erythrobacter sp. SG61-1L TaxID=1603897 RepID=UPI0006C8FB6C|nr:hypothetical protein [Erythrobacter sp. SG61-1L]KPL67676.1 hypothetical protein SZ64_05820 [Erythrobacter sp. SG61-1L]